MHRQGGRWETRANASWTPYGPISLRILSASRQSASANWDDTRVNNALKAAGTNPTGRKGSVNVYDPYGYQVQIASIDGENPFI